MPESDRKGLRAGWLVFGFVLILAIITLDQWTKSLILATPELNALGCLPYPPSCGKIALPGPMSVSMVWNRGISFGTFEADGLARWGLFALSGIIAVVFAIWLLRARRRLTLIALALVVGGAVGNMIDRARFGAVVDFLDFSEIWFVWVFNIADAAITVGAILLFLDQYLVSRGSKRAAESPDAGTGA